MTTCATWLPKLAEMPAAKRAELPGVSVGRARQLVAGAMVAEAVMDIGRASQNW